MTSGRRPEQSLCASAEALTYAPPQEQRSNPEQQGAACTFLRAAISCSD